MGQFLAFKGARRALLDLWSQLTNHIEIVAGFERLRRYQRLAFYFVQRIFKFGQAIRWVDVNQNEPCLRGSELTQRPL